MKGMARFYAVLVTMFVVIAVVGIRRKTAAGEFQPMSLSNLSVVGQFLEIFFLLAFLLICGYAFQPSENNV
jgi:hypothetical protein